MIKYKRVKTTAEIINDVRCNQCGKSLGTKDGPLWYGLQRVVVCGMYGSPVIPDGTKYEFSLCENCIMEMIRGFKIKADCTDLSPYGD